jgi:hypothetical protein
MHAWEMHAWEMHAWEIHAYERHAYEIAYGRCTTMRDARLLRIHAYEMAVYGMHTP